MKEIMTTDIALHPDQWQQTLFGHLKFFSETIKPSSSSSGTLSHGASPNIDYNNPENAPFVQAARFLLLGYHLKHHQQATAENRHCWRTRPQS
jgi:hypothetical protein